ncbi:hypothetical protein HPB47_019720 [Ixodes persulcatus]|uniref:Uncharacterized protein n=1 Tax=Ixodes persulcatus TaxID=34615 RepID=A0AC60QHG6_IXOPE|nr:hypothetical protein HPB47_019720 [Ixodes persulcatus]
MEEDLQLITDPRYPTLPARNAASRDTTPDLAFTNEEEVTWKKTQVDLGSDHKIVGLTIPLKGKQRPPRTFKCINWDAFWHLNPTEDIKNIKEWTSDLQRAVTQASRTIETTDDTDGTMDSRLAHLIEAKQSIQAR